MWWPLPPPLLLMRGAAAGLAFWLTLPLAVTLHEYGHVLVARMLALQVVDPSHDGQHDTATRRRQSLSSRLKGALAWAVHMPLYVLSLNPYQDHLHDVATAPSVTIVLPAGPAGAWRGAAARHAGWVVSLCAVGVVQLLRHWAACATNPPHYSPRFPWATAARSASSPLSSPSPLEIALALPTSTVASCGEGATHDGSSWSLVCWALLGASAACFAVLCGAVASDLLQLIRQPAAATAAAAAAADAADAAAGDKSNHTTCTSDPDPSWSSCKANPDCWEAPAPLPLLSFLSQPSALLLRQRTRRRSCPDGTTTTGCTDTAPERDSLSDGQGHRRQRQPPLRSASQGYEGDDDDSDYYCPDLRVPPSSHLLPSPSYVAAAAAGAAMRHTTTVVTATASTAAPATPAANTTMLTLFCGNIGMLVACIRDTTVDFMKVLKSQVAISSQRGAQSGGLVTLVDKDPSGLNVDGIRSRCAPGKRDHLATSLSKQFRRAMGPSPSFAADHGLFVGHTRFATSSQPSTRESHPHQWSPPVQVSVWRVDPTDKRMKKTTEKFGVWITHNGDLDFWRLMGQDRTHHEIGAFLAAALGNPCPARCDSVKVAGMIELLRTQGMWSAALRLAYFDTADVSFEDVLAAFARATVKGAAESADAADEEQGRHGGGGRGATVATPQELQRLAEAIEKAFEGLLLTAGGSGGAGVYRTQTSGMPPLRSATNVSGASGLAANRQPGLLPAPEQIAGMARASPRPGAGQQQPAFTADGTGDQVSELATAVGSGVPFARAAGLLPPGVGRASLDPEGSRRGPDRSIRRGGGSLNNTVKDGSVVKRELSLAIEMMTFSNTAANAATLAAAAEMVHAERDAAAAAAARAGQQNSEGSTLTFPSTLAPPGASEDGTVHAGRPAVQRSG